LPKYPSGDWQLLSRSRFKLYTHAVRSNAHDTVELKHVKTACRGDT